MVIMFGVKDMPRKRRFSQGRLSILKVTMFSSVWGFAVVGLCILAFAFVITKIDVTGKIVTMFSSVALCVGAYFGGLLAAKRRRKNGLLMGVLCGLFMFFVILIISTCFIRTIASFSPSFKLVLTILSGGIGGIVGVNSKNSRY